MLSQKEIMSLHWERRKPKSPKATSIDNVTSDFASLKVSTLKKASRISAEVDRITIGPRSVADDSDQRENIENEQNSCNVKRPKDSNVSPKQSTVSTQDGITFSVKKILLESELQRQEEVRRKIQQRIQHMEENGRAIQEQLANSRSSMARERERRSAEKLACILAEEERLAEQEELRRKEEQQLHAQRAQEQKEKLEREVEEYRRNMKEKEELTKAVIACRNEHAMKYCDIISLSSACKDKHALNALLDSHASKLTQLLQQIKTTDEKIKSGSLTATDLSFIEALISPVDDLLNVLRTEIEQINARYEKSACNAQAKKEAQFTMTIDNNQVNQAVPIQPDKGTATEENVEKQTSQVTAGQEKIVVPDAVDAVESSVYETKSETSNDSAECKIGDTSEHISEELLQIYLKSQRFLESYKESYRDFSESASTKKLRFECQKAINIPVNAISAINEHHLRDKFDRLHNLLTGKSSPNVSDCPQGIKFCKEHLAKKIVSQGETLVSSKPEMAFPIAAIIVALWNEHSDFGELLMAHLHRTCPFTVPFLRSQRDGESNEDYYQYLGCKYSEDGTVEKQDKFLKRMSGLMRLYASITITGQRRGITKHHPHGLQHAWRWLAIVLNIEPTAETGDLCATLILDVLEVAGNTLWCAYPTQFYKLLQVLMEHYYSRMRSVRGDGGGPSMRLEEFLRNALQRNTIRPPNGVLSPNFW